MKTLPAPVLALFDAGRIAVRSLIKAEFGTGTYGLWNGTGDLVYGGVTYKANSIISVSGFTTAKGMEAHPFEIILPESKDFGLSPDILAEIESEDYKGRPITLYDAFFEPDTRNLLHVEPMQVGYLDVIDHMMEDGKFSLVGRCETNAIDNHRDGYRTASNADQQLVSAGDEFFSYASVVKTETHYFGRGDKQ